MDDAVREAVLRRIAELRADPDFQARLERYLVEHRKVLEALERT